MANHTILIIDYEPRNVEAASRPLQSAGYEVETAADGVAGLRAFEKHAPALVLIEAMLPKKHGFEVCQEIKKTSVGKRTPVVITTAVYRGRKYRTQALHIYGADEYLEKPFTGEQILEVCARFLGEAPGAAPEAEPKQIAVNESAAAPPMGSSPPARPEPATEAPGTFSKIVGDLTEEEITERLDAVLPSERSDPVDETDGSTETAQVAPAPADGGIVDDLPPEIAEAFVATVQPVTHPPAEEPMVREAEPDRPEQPESAEATEPVPEGHEEERAKSTEEQVSDGVEASNDEPEDAKLDSVRGRKRGRKKKKRRSRSKASRSKASGDHVDEAEPDLAPVTETVAETPPAEAAAVTETEEPAPEPPAADEDVAPAEATTEPESAETVVTEDTSEPQAEETAPATTEETAEEVVAEPKSEADELAEAVSAAIDGLQAPDELESGPEAAPPEAEEQVVEALDGDEQISEPSETDEVAVVPEPVASTEIRDEAPEETTAGEIADETAVETPAEAAETLPEPRRKTGLWMGVAAAVVVGLAVTLFFVLRGGGDGATAQVATPKPTPAPMRPSPVAEQMDVAGAAMVSGSGSDESEATTVVAAGVPTAKPEPPVVPPTPPPQTGETASERVPPKVEEKPAAAQTTETEKPPVTTETDDAAAVEEVEALAPAVVAGADALPDSTPESTVEADAAAMEPLDSQPPLPELPAEPEPAPAVESEPTVEEPAPAAPAPPPKAATGDLVPLHQVDQQPTPLDQPRPKYPVSARRLGKQGTVVLNVLVDENGDVIEVELIRGVGEELDGAAIRAVKGWTYKPARKDGVGVKVWKPEKVVFKL
jgi:TonB family protein